MVGNVNVARVQLSRPAQVREHRRTLAGIAGIGRHIVDDVRETIARVTLEPIQAVGIGVESRAPGLGAVFGPSKMLKTLAVDR